MATKRQAGGRIGKRAIIRDPRGLRAAKFTKEIADQGSKMYDQATKASLAKKLGMKILTKEALAESQAYRDIAKDIAKVNPSLDKQIIAEIENNARLISDAYMKAYSPDGTPEDMIAFQTLDNNLTGQLNDLTMMVGAMDADLEAYDLAKEEGRLIKKTNELGEIVEDEDYDLFRYGLTSGDSDVLLSKDENGRYILKGRNPAGSEEEQVITISEYSDNLKKGGSFKSINPNLEGQAIEFGQSIATKLLPQYKKTYKGQGGTPYPNPKFDSSKPENAKTNPKMLTGSAYFTIEDEDLARNTMTNYFDGNFAEGFKNLTGSKSVPKEEELWEYLKNEGFINKTFPSWSSAPNATKQQMLNDAYVDFVIKNNVSGAVEGEVFSGKGILDKQ